MKLLNANNHIDNDNDNNNNLCKMQQEELFGAFFFFMPCHFLFDIAVYIVQKEKGAEKKIFIKSPFWSFQ